MDQVNLKMGENVRAAMDAAFEEGQARLSAGYVAFDPFTVIAVDGGLEFADHPGATPTAVRESVKMLLAQEVPEGYALCYDGYVDTALGRHDALIVEVAGRGDDHASRLALIYTLDSPTVTFEADYTYTGEVDHLYPAGTKPIVSGLATLGIEQAEFDDDADFDESDNE